MDNIQVNGNYLDYYGVNSDFSGSRDFENEQEIVAFHNESTIRIWLNDQTEGFSIHWHNAMEIIQICGELLRCTDIWSELPRSTR